MAQHASARRCRHHRARNARCIATGLMMAISCLAACGADTSAHVRPTPTIPACASADSLVAAWSLSRQAHQVVTVPVDEKKVAAVAEEVAAGVGGVILFGSTAPPDLAGHLRNLVALGPGPIAPLVMTDEEGGAVQRLANLVGSMPSARQMAATMTPAQVRRLAHQVGTRMAGAHVTVDLAPVLDLDSRPGPSAENPDGTRSFSIRAAATAAYGLAFARGLSSAHVLPVVKHFPGLGGASGNTDHGPAWTRPWPVIRRKDLRPFRAAIDAGLPAVMVTTARIPGLTRRPAALSGRLVRGELRTTLRFTGLVMSDSLSGGAVAAAGYSVPRAAVRALHAGVDMVLFNAGPKSVAGVTSAVVHALVAAARRDDPFAARLRDAAIHVLAAQQATRCPSPRDVAHEGS